MDLEQSLVGNGSRSRGSSKTRVLIVLIAVLNVLFVGTLIALIVVLTLPHPSGASSSSSEQHEDHKDIVKFTEFSAIRTTIFFYGDINASHFHHQETQNYTAFGNHQWCIRTMSAEGAETYRMFSKEDDDTVVECFHLVGHDNCYARTADISGDFSVPYDATLLQKSVPCQNICSPPTSLAVSPRAPSLCDRYTVGSGVSLIEYIVESDTNYPVEIRVTTFSPAGSYTYLSYYSSFIPGKPEGSESLLKPYDGVTVYDFRDGKGDAGSGASNIYEDTNSVVRSTVTRASRRNSVEILFDALNSDSKSHHQAIRNFLHLPPIDFSGIQSLPTLRTPVREIRDIPDSFDVREKWPNCTSVFETITNQGTCGSCWAMSSTGVLSDRLCIAQNKQMQLSPQYLMACSYITFVCQGGTAWNAWSELTRIGTVSESCFPFLGRYSDCPARCEDGTEINDSNKVYPKKFVMPWNDTAEGRVRAIQEEILTNGPVQGSLWVFSDFQLFYMQNPKGIYHRSPEATWVDGHSVRVVGWGREDDVDYWLFANSWGKEWGDNGFFKIRRGNNECDFEEMMAAGLFA